MAIQLETAIKRFRGLSTDEKPGRSAPVGEAVQLPPVGSVFTELDTGERYIWGGSWPWVRQEQTIEVLFRELTDVMLDMLAEIRIVRQATATLANNAWETNFPSFDE